MFIEKKNVNIYWRHNWNDVWRVKYTNVKVDCTSSKEEEEKQKEEEEND